ncbi:transcriptional regulator [Lentilactobacillus fungorum]|uniref:Transcriptional regulator n=1 Tax=Lentilactobacillus fungorum TaxID=2201250 RepID=A0ABQ3W1I8_9LACO|nr:LysR family transcriptional regulator [Lentilactobacillus fungorum]GHP14571.1 transcriptional regulator [Lentilactobacillus fungorum]
MEFRVLRYFLAVCQEKNISKAAERLHIAQPSLSKQMKDLEDELGVTLFTRGHRQISLTEEGYFLRDRAQEMIDMEQQTTQALTGSKIVIGNLNIGTGQSFEIRPVVKIIDQIIQNNSHVHFNFYDGYADDIEAKVNDGSLDFGIIMGNRPIKDFESLILPERNQFYAIFNRALPLAKKDKIIPADLIKYPVIFSAQGQVNNKFRDWWGNLYDQVNNIANCNLSYTASLLASEGHAIQVTYNNLYDKDLENLTARPLSPKITDPNIVIWKKNRKLSNLGNLFLEKLRNSLNQ